MPPKSLTSNEIKAAILHRVARRGVRPRAGGKYIQTQKVINQLGKRIMRNGKKVTKAIDGLIKSGLLWAHKNGATISANPHRMNEILGFIERHYKL